MKRPVLTHTDVVFFRFGPLSPGIAEAAQNVEERSASTGELLIKQQERTRGDRAMIGEGRVLVELALLQPSRILPYRMAEFAALYEVLLRLQRSPIDELNSATALSMVPARALQLVDALVAAGATRGIGRVNQTRTGLGIHFVSST